jgi:predicted outer membrane repeat protein
VTLSVNYSRFFNLSHFNLSQRKIRNIVVALSLMLAMLVSFVPAPTFAATTTTLTSCTEAGLRQAVSKAANGDTILFGCSGTITLTGGSDRYIEINKNLTLDGNGQQVIISGGNNTSLFFVWGNNSTASFKNLSLANAYSTSSGAAIFVQRGGNASILNVNFFNNTARYGGAIYNQGATVSINNALFLNNLGTDRGGAIYNEGGTLNFNNTTFTSNNAYSEGGAIYSGAGGSLKVTYGTFTNNSSSNYGGAIDSYSPATVEYSTFTGNSSQQAGAIQNFSSLSVNSSTFSGNSASKNSGGAIATHQNSTLNVVNSTFYGNSAVNSGGAISNGGFTTITNSTLAGNTAQYAGSGVRNWEADGITTVVTLVNTIMANGAGEDCVGPITDGGYNLETTNTCGLNPNNHSKPNTDPQFNTAGLKFNGGYNQTIALQPTSPAAAAGNVAVCQSALVGGKDQRGLARPATYCDMGAYDSFGGPAASVGAAATSTNLTLSSISVMQGKDVSMRAVVVKPQGQTNPLTGYVVFKEGTTILAVGTVDSNGVAAAIYSTAGRATGSHNLVAQYYGDNSYAQSTSNIAYVSILQKLI